MKKFEIVPHLGVGPIKFGMTKAEVEACFGPPEFNANYRVGYMSGFFIDFDGEDKVEYIELADSKDFEATYKGVNLHKTKALDALELVGCDDNFDKDNVELGYSYIFKALQLSLWRGITPESECDSDGQFFEAVGIACGKYF